MSRKKLTVSKTDYARIEELASRGLSISLIADSLGISKATLDRRISESDELTRVLSRGRAKGVESVASVAYQMAISGKYPAMTMFWLKCNAGWREKKEEELAAEVPFTIVFSRGGGGDKQTESIEAL